MKIKFELEYTLNTSPRILFPRISTASGLSEWFADDVRVNGKIYTFVWEGSEQDAEMILKKDGKYVRFHWLDEEDSKTYFEFRFHIDELTNDLALIVTDFADEDEVEDTKELWNSQIQSLKQLLGL